MFVGYRILYFYKKENAFYLEKSTGRIRKYKNASRAGNISFEEKQPGARGDEELPVRVYFCGVPEYYGRRRGWGGKSFPVSWNFGQLLCLMQNCCEYISADAYYLEEGFERELTEGEFGFTPGRQRMCGELIGKLTGQFRGIDSILYLADEFCERALEMPLGEELLRKLHYFFYMGERTEQYAAMEENLWQEYGMPLMTVRRTEELVTCRLKRLLVLDDRQEGDTDWEMLPRGCVYLDLWSDTGRRSRIAEKRVDIKYMSEYLYLRQNLDTP